MSADDEKRPRGRPAVVSEGGYKRANLTLDEASLATAARIHENTSAAVRIALAFWAEHNPPTTRVQRSDGPIDDRRQAGGSSVGGHGKPGGMA